jgi:hypothetical protein
MHCLENKIFLTGPINMSSAMTLQVDGTLRAKSGNNTADGVSAWPQIPPLPSYGNSRDGETLQFQAFVYALNVNDIAINGSGTIDGSGEWWWANQHNRSAVPAGRPNLIQFVNVKRIEVTGVTLRDSPFWCLHPVYCEDVHVHHMLIRSRMYAPNSDGVDPDSCKNVMIGEGTALFSLFVRINFLTAEHNDISTGDDGIAIKAGVCGSDKAPSSDSDPKLQGGPTPLKCVDEPKFSDGTYLTQVQYTAQIHTPLSTPLSSHPSLPLRTSPSATTPFASAWVYPLEANRPGGLKTCSSTTTLWGCAKQDTAWKSAAAGALPCI